MAVPDVVLRGVRVGDIFPREQIPGGFVAFCTVARLPEYGHKTGSIKTVSEEDDLCTMMATLYKSGEAHPGVRAPALCIEEIQRVWTGALKSEEVVVVATLMTADLSKTRFHVLVPWLKAEREYVYFVYDETEGLMLPLVFVRGSGSSERWMYSFRNKKLQ